MAKKFLVNLKKGVDVREYQCKPRHAVAAVVAETDLADGAVFTTDDGKFVVVSKNEAAVYDSYEKLPEDVKEQKSESELAP
ncbi:MAG: hypothetical protein ACXVIG_03220 [Halobacteriota archaeon]